MNRRALVMGVLCAVVTAAGLTYAQDQPSQTPSYELRLRVVSSLSGNHRAVPAVVWLEPLEGTTALPFVPRDHYTLLQKHRTFIPHLQLIPWASIVQFPNPDPFSPIVFPSLRENGLTSVYMKRVRISQSHF